MVDPGRVRKLLGRIADRRERPADYEVGFAVLREHDVVSRELATRLSSMARFRNLLVHVYADVDDARVHRFLQADLGDFDDFASAVLDVLEEGT